MLTTAAGTIPPAKVLVLGAGVAGLQAIATARRLGAVVSGYDVRAAVKEQVQSLGATFLEFDLGGDAEGAGGYAKELTPEQQERQRAWMVEQIGMQRRRHHDGARSGPQSADARQRSGGRRDEARQRRSSISPPRPAATARSPSPTKSSRRRTASRSSARRICPSTMPYHASQLYSRNVYALLSPWIKDGELTIDMDDDVAKGACVAARRHASDRRKRLVTDVSHSRQPADRARARGFRRLRGHLEGSDDAAHAADVGHQRDSRHRARRRASSSSRSSSSRHQRAGSYGCWRSWR